MARPTPLEKPGDHIRRVAEASLEATRQLELALLANDVSAARRALEQGALPSHAQFRDKKGRPKSGAIAKAMEMGGRVDMVQLLLDFDAPLPLTGPGAAMQTALKHDRIEAISLLARRIKPRASDWIKALERPMATFRALDDEVPMDRTRNLGSQQLTGYPPLFLVRDPELLDYLIQTGADALQTPGPHPKAIDHPWTRCSSVRHAIASNATRWGAHYPGGLARVVRTLHELGVALTEEDFSLAKCTKDFALICYYIDHGFRFAWGEGELDEFHLKVRAYEQGVDLAVSTPPAQGSGSRRL